MSKLITTAILALVAFAMLASGADAAWPRRWRTYTVVPAQVTPAPATTARAAPAAQGYRTFSYQPSYQPAAPTFRSYSAPRKQSWDYPKTDARRYSNVR